MILSLDVMKCDVHYVSPVGYSCICDLLKQLVLTGTSFAYGVPSVLYFTYGKIPLFLPLDAWKPNQVRMFVTVLSFPCIQCGCP